MKVQLPSCLAAPEEAAVASTSQSMSVTEAFTGATVLVTGGTGYLGSLVRNVHQDCLFTHAPLG